MDPFAGALEDVDALHELYDAPDDRVWRKDIGRLDEHCRTLIAASPMVLLASTDGRGGVDVTPRGGPAGFVTVLDDGHLALPDATGNRRLDTLRNVIATGRVGTLFLTPGRDWTLRVNGRACVSADPELLARVTPVGKPPRTAIVVACEEVYTHCPKAFVRSGLWDPQTWPDPSALPRPAQVLHAHLAVPGSTLEDEERRQAESLIHRLA